MIDKIKELLSQYSGNIDHYADEYFIVNNYVGGNIDDAYYLGIDQGQGEVARLILDLIKQAESD